MGGGDDGGRGDAAEERGLILDLRHLVAMGTRLASLPVRVAHNDAKAGNVLVDTRTGQPLMLVDLDTVMPGTVLWDVGDLVRSATATVPEDEPGAAFDRARYDALIGGWRAELDGVLTAEENGLIGIAAPVVTYEQAVRFLTDHLMGDVYYRTTRPGQNLDRARSQLSLLQSMLDSLGVRSP